MEQFRIGIWVWDGVEELDFAGPYEVLTCGPDRLPTARDLGIHGRGLR